MAFSARDSPKPEAAASNDEKRVPVEGSDSVKPPPSGGFLGRDTIANAAARIGPAVVNLSVPQGFAPFSYFHDDSLRGCWVIFLDFFFVKVSMG